MEHLHKHWCVCVRFKFCLSFQVFVNFPFNLHTVVLQQLWLFFFKIERVSYSYQPINPAKQQLLKAILQHLLSFSHALHRHERPCQLHLVNYGWKSGPIWWQLLSCIIDGLATRRDESPDLFHFICSQCCFKYLIF